MSCAEFWRAGVAEVLVVIEAAGEQARSAAMADVTAAWLTAAWSRARTLTPLREQIDEIFGDDDGVPEDQASIDQAVADRRREIEDFRGVTRGQ